MSDSGKITVNYFCLGAFFIFIGSVLLCALGFTVVLPFEVTRAWPSVQCTVINSTYDPTVCSCDEQLNVFDTCVSKYPCLKIHVFYVPPPGSVLPLSPWPNRTTAAGGGIWSVTRRGGAERSRRSTDWIGEELNASHEFKVGNVFQTVLYNTRNVVSKIPVDASTAVPFESIPVTTTDERFLETVVKDLEEVGKVRGRSLLSSTLLPIGKSHPSKEGDVGLDRWTLAPPDGEQTEVGENWTDLLRMSKYEADDDDKGIETADERRGHGGGGGGRVFATLYRSWDDSFNRQCSLTECGDETWNVKEARRFRDDWGRIGQSLPCFYNPLHPDMVIIERTSTVAAVHAVLWPGLCLIGGVTLWIGLCLGCWSLGSESTCKDDYGPIY